jgi:hypothetical protein
MAVTSILVYVTREHPLTGADELLVLEEDGELRVPEGEDAAAAVLEQAGIEVEVVRELAPGFVHARAHSGLPERWQHDGRPFVGSPCAPTCRSRTGRRRTHTSSSAGGSSST